MVDPKLLEILVCPRCRGPLRHTDLPPALVCDECKMRYPIRDDIPILLIDEAETIP
jgi:hypothetical protein